MVDMVELEERIKNYNKKTTDLEIAQEAARKNKELLKKKIDVVKEELQMADEQFIIYSDAIEVLRQVSDQTVTESYDFISKAVNTALERIFPQERRIELREYSRGKNPQLEMVLKVEGGRERSMKLNTGRGLTQIVSFLSILSIIVITKSRKIMIMDEILSGLSASSRKVIADIMWNFTEIGFQFIINEHGFVPKGSKVIFLENQAGIGRVSHTYIEEHGMYLDDTIGKSRARRDKVATDDGIEFDDDEYKAIGISDM